MNNLMLTKRHLLGGIALASSAAVLAACNGKDDNKESAAKDANPGIDNTKTASTSDVPKSDGSVDVAKLMAPGALPEMSIGKADAPVTIVEYMSMTCPHCARFQKDTFPGIKTKYVDTGKVRYILREFPLDPVAAAAIMLARCAPPEQYFPFVDVLFQQQMSWAAADDKRASLMQMSKLAGFTQESFNACLTNQKLLDDVNAVREKGAKDFGVNATPTFFVNGARYAGEMTVDQMSAIIDSKL
ncbi:protein-disulfide isomerase [Rhizobium aquaticum]|uniref:Protein-disulfide isomerase n=1 Tax=Rhizobium aquaticum TaxID=1549636 RepID=A0ABV2J2U3_9HYPH